MATKPSIEAMALMVIDALELQAELFIMLELAYERIEELEAELAKTHSE